MNEWQPKFNEKGSISNSNAFNCLDEEDFSKLSDDDLKRAANSIYQGKYLVSEANLIPIMLVAIFYGVPSFIILLGTGLTIYSYIMFGVFSLIASPFIKKIQFKDSSSYDKKFKIVLAELEKRGYKVIYRTYESGENKIVHYLQFKRG